MRIVLASASPRRRELLGVIGLPFEVIPSTVEESIDPGIPPASAAQLLALSKAREVASRLSDGLVIGADTIVVVDGKILGKPSSPDDAVKMLRMLSGREHSVISGVAIVDARTGREMASHEETLVTFGALEERVIRAYVATGEPMDKAGAYGIQGKAGMLITGICGCYFNVVGLPLARLASMLAQFGVDVWAGAEQPCEERH